MRYEKLFALLEARGIPKTRLTDDGIISKETLKRLVHDEPVSLRTLERLCTLLGCRIYEIAE